MHLQWNIKMNNQKIHPHQLMDSYICDRLDERERDAFEEHLLFCPSCRQRLQARERLLRALHLADTRAGSDRGNGNNGRCTPLYLETILSKTPLLFQTSAFLNRIAAVLVLGVGLGVLLWFAISQHPANIIDKTGSDEAQHADCMPGSKTELLHWAAALSENRILEEFMHFNHRTARSIDLQSPQNGQFCFNASVHFSGTSAIDATLVVKIYSNDAKSYTLDQPLNRFRLNQYAGTFDLRRSFDLANGLYYFTIESLANDEPLYVGKFYLLNGAPPSGVDNLKISEQ